MKYLYETHLHTAQSSTCAVSAGADYIRAYKEAGYTGIIVTDHFYNGNSCIFKDLPWTDWVDCFVKGYEAAKAEGDRLGLDVFFGWEETFDSGDDYLIYGLDKEWLLKHPEVRGWTHEEQYRIVSESGGCVVQAHPFRQRPYIRALYLSADVVDAVEVANGCNDPYEDMLAWRYADQQGLPITSGTDMHFANTLNPSALFGVLFDRKMESIQDYVEAVKTGRIEIQTPPNRLPNTARKFP